MHTRYNVITQYTAENGWGEFTFCAWEQQCHGGEANACDDQHFHSHLPQRRMHCAVSMPSKPKTNSWFGCFHCFIPCKIVVFNWVYVG